MTTSFTDDDGSVSSYEFAAREAQDEHGYLVNRVAVGLWDGLVPWPVKESDKPANRINLDNAVHYYCPMVYRDISTKRVGLSFNVEGGEVLASDATMTQDQKYFSENEQFYVVFQADGNLVVRAEDHSFKWGLRNQGGVSNDPKLARAIMQADGHFCVYNENDKYAWGIRSVDSEYQLVAGSKLVLTNDGELVVVDPSDRILFKITQGRPASPSRSGICPIEDVSPDQLCLLLHFYSS